MPKVRYTYALQRFYPDLKEDYFDASTLADLLNTIDGVYPGIRDYLVEEGGSIRKHVNIFVDSKLLRDRSHLEYDLSKASEVYIMQALSGG